MTRQFNYVILSVTIDGKTILMDATEKHLPMGEIPERCLNGEAIQIIIEGKKFRWINLEAQKKSRTIINADMKLKQDGSLSGTINVTRDGYDALETRKIYASKGKEEYLKSLKADNGWELENTKVEGLEDLRSQLVITHEVSLDNHSDVAAGLIYLNPFFTGRLEDNPFKSNQRLYPVDFGSPFDKIVISKIEIPEGYIVDEVPEPKALALPGNAGKYMHNVLVAGNFVNVTSSFSITKSLYTQNEYALLREFYNQVVAKQAEQIVLKKK
jgi:hypothetical protein